MGGPLFTPKFSNPKPSKESSATLPHHHAATIIATFRRKKGVLSFLTLITFLCSLSYLIGLWQHQGHRHGTTTIAAITPCNTTSAAAAGPSLDFSTHHAADVEPTMTSSAASPGTMYPPCHVSYSEYTPCEDPRRSIGFRRRRKEYMERHCPALSELLKCRVPAPYGYKSPFKWPESRDYAWFNNVPHTELAVEKAHQNWIRFEDDRFRFPGSGTSFPNGADAYIREIGRLTDLKSGSIRTAIDTGCRVVRT